MKKILILFAIALLTFNAAFAATDKYSKEYLQSKNHFSITKGFAERVAEKAIKKALKKETGANFDVKVDAYNTSSLKKGIFKNVELTGNDVFINDIPVEYINIKSLTDYNYIDYTQNPIVYMSDMEYAYELKLSDEAINATLKDKQYQTIINTVNRYAGSMFTITGVRSKFVDNKCYLIMDYNLPILKLKKDKSFVAATDFEVINGRIKAKNVHIDTSYGNLGLNKVANLINLLNPLEFTLDLLDDNNYKGNIENINFVDNLIKINGKISVKGKELSKWIFLKNLEYFV